MAIFRKQSRRNTDKKHLSLALLTHLLGDARSEILVLTGCDCPPIQTMPWRIPLAPRRSRTQESGILQDTWASTPISLRWSWILTMNNNQTTSERDRKIVTIRSRAQAFETLGLRPDANPERIHRRFRRLAFLYHPDRNKTQTDASLFKRVSQAYRFLKRFGADIDGRHHDNKVECVCHKCDRVSELYVGLDRNRYCRDCLLSIDGRRGLPSPPIVFASFGFAMATLFVSCVTMLAFFTTGHMLLGWTTLLLAGVSFLSIATTAITVSLTAHPKRNRHRRSLLG